MSSSEVEITSFSSQQRRCHLLLLFYLPDSPVTLDTLRQINQVDKQAAWQDITAVAEEIQRYHQLEMQEDVTGGWRLYGEELNKRLCLLHWLRRALRLSPDFVRQHFAPGLQRHLDALQVEKALYDTCNLQALLRYCSTQLRRPFSMRDSLFLQLFLQYSLGASHQVTFSEQQIRWLQAKAEWETSHQIIHCWKKRNASPQACAEAPLISLALSLIHAPVPEPAAQPDPYSLHQAITALIARFQQFSAVQFTNENGLRAQLYTHLAQALDRAVFSIKIDDSLAQEMITLYPRLLRATTQAMVPFERQFGIYFAQEELSLVAVIFGAWLMQENALHEKQVLLLTGRDAMLEQTLEQQIRELTLIPLHIKHLDIEAWQQQGAPDGIALVISPYATALPLYSPQLIHVELPLSDYHQQRIRTLLEA